MIIARHETITLPNNEDGQFMAPYYMDDMSNAGLTTYSTATTTCIVVHGSYVGDCSEEYIKQLRDKVKEEMKRDKRIQA